MSKMQAPKWLSAEAKKHFEEIVGFAATDDMFISSDAFLVALFSNELEEYIRCVKELETGSTVTITTGNGYDKESDKPEVMQKDRAIKNMLNIINKLGMSPEARAKLKIELAKKTTDDPFTAAMANLKKKNEG